MSHTDLLADEAGELSRVEKKKEKEFLSAEMTAWILRQKKRKREYSG